MRGARLGPFHHAGGVGLIPARAGSTPLRRSRQYASRAHPRPCGEHMKSRMFPMMVLGSSPPVRGALARFTVVSRVVGLIPARAGSTPRHSLPEARTGAHPRPCGEHQVRQLREKAARGSSPPVRGARRTPPCARVQGGLIPARAGSTWCPLP